MPVAVVYAFGIILLILAWLLLLATRASYQYTFGLMLSWVAKQLHGFKVGVFGIGGHPFDWLGDVLDTVNNYIHRKIGEGITHCENGVLWTVHNVIATVQWLGRVLTEIPHETGKALHYLRKVTIPQLLAAGFGPLGVLVYGQARAIAKLLHLHVPSLTPHEIVKLVRQAVAVPLPFPRLGKIEREIAAENKRLSRVEKGAIIGTALGVVSFALSKLGLGSLRCSNTRNASKGVCGMNPSLLESLLADTLLIVGTVSLVDFAKGLQPIVAEIEKPIRVFWRAA